VFALWATGVTSTISPPQITTAKDVPQPRCRLGYAPGFRSISTTIRFTSWENFGSGSRSFGRCPGSYGARQNREHHLLTPALTSKTLPSTFSCHAGIPWPVSKLWVESPVSGCCHTWPETVWLRNIRSVRGTYTRIKIKKRRSKRRGLS
jgi:hypothetical protein